MTRTVLRLTLTILTVAVLAAGAQALCFEDSRPQPTCGKVAVVSSDDNAADLTVQKKVLLFCGDDEGKPRTCLLKCGGDQERTVEVCLAGGGGPGGGGLPGVVWLAGGTEATDADSGWLGVGLGEVQPALAAQLGLKGDHVMITNVVADSPAERAGLEQYDIIAAINGEPVGGSVGAFAKEIGKAGPGAQVKLGILRGGQEQTVQATLGSRPAGEAEWTYDMDFNFGPSITEQFRTRGKVFKFGPGGTMVLEDLGDLKELEDLPPAVRDLLPDIDDIRTQLWVDAHAGDVTAHIKTRVERDGQIIEIEAKGSDGITVRRTTVDAGGDKKVVEKVYDSPEKLQAADEEAFEIYAGIQGGHMIELKLDDLPGADALKRYFGANDLKRDVDQAQVEARQAFEEAMQAYQEAMKQVDSAKIGKLHQFAPFQDPSLFSHFGQAKHNFTVDSDGHIEIRIRKGDSEVVLNYNSEDDLRTRNRDMYDKYMEVMKAPADN